MSSGVLCGFDAGPTGHNSSSQPHPAGPSPTVHGDMCDGTACGALCVRPVRLHEGVFHVFGCLPPPPPFSKFCPHASSLYPAPVPRCVQMHVSHDNPRRYPWAKGCAGCPGTSKHAPFQGQGGVAGSPPPPLQPSTAPCSLTDAAAAGGWARFRKPHGLVPFGAGFVSLWHTTMFQGGPEFGAGGSLSAVTTVSLCIWVQQRRMVLSGDGGRSVNSARRILPPKGWGTFLPSLVHWPQCIGIRISTVAPPPLQYIGLVGWVRGEGGDRAYRPPLRKCGLIQATEWALNRCFQDFLGHLFFEVLNAGLGVCDAMAEGKGGSFVSVMVHSIDNNIIPHIAAPRCLFGCDVGPWLTLPFPAWLLRTVLCCRASRACFSTGWALSRSFAWAFGTAAGLAQGGGGGGTIT